MDAENLSKALSLKFFENGNYDRIGPVFAVANKDASLTFATAAASAAVEEIEEEFQVEEGFAGLSVQSVGFTAGAEEEKVIIYVAKGSKRALKELPSSIDGVSVQARVMGRLRAGPAPAAAAGLTSHFFEKNGRVACGSSCAPSNQNYAGTFGALATDGSQIIALSNNHVFAACNHTPVGMPMLSPASGDARPLRSHPRAICEHAAIVELRSGMHPLVVPMALDAAIAAVGNPLIVSSWQGDNDGYDTPRNFLTPASGMKVKKVGRTTGLTFGTVEALVPTPWVLSYKDKKFSADVWFQDTWTVVSDDADPFALPGDSGSLIVTADGSAAVGLLFAVNGRQYAMFSPIEAVLAAFGNLTLVSNHGI